MSDDNTTTTPAQTQGEGSPAIAATPGRNTTSDTSKSAPKKARAQARTTRASTKQSSNDAPKYKCAGCGKDVVFDQTTTIGNNPPLQHHGCSQMKTKLHEYFLAQVRDPSLPLPSATA